MILLNPFFLPFKIYLICCLILDLAIADGKVSCNLFRRCHEKIIFSKQRGFVFIPNCLKRTECVRPHLRRIFGCIERTVLVVWCIKNC